MHICFTECSLMIMFLWDETIERGKKEEQGKEYERKQRKQRRDKGTEEENVGWGKAESCLGRRARWRRKHSERIRIVWLVLRVV